MNTLYNGKRITKENLLSMMQDVDIDDRANDMADYEKEVIRIVAEQKYPGADEDLAYLVERLQETDDLGYVYICANLQDVYDILSKGDDWFLSDILKLKRKIENKINRQYWERGHMGTETANIYIPITNREKELLENSNILDNYCYEFVEDYPDLGSCLNITYSEE